MYEIDFFFREKLKSGFRLFAMFCQVSCLINGFLLQFSFLNALFGLNDFALRFIACSICFLSNFFSVVRSRFCLRSFEGQNLFAHFLK